MPGAKRSQRAASTPEVITDAKTSASAEAAARQNRYMILMAIRVVCILIAFLIPGWLKWPAIAAAAILPGVAVLIANQPNQKLLMANAAAAEQSDQPALPSEQHVTVRGEWDDSPGQSAQSPSASG